jgi:hypothetical protein
LLFCPDEETACMTRVPTGTDRKFNSRRLASGNTLDDLR